MAGIGFSLRKIMREDTLGQIVRAYSYAGIIGSGPWIISVIALVAIYTIGLRHSGDVRITLLQFQTTITYLISISLVISGIFQYAFVRYVADRLFAKSDTSILPSTLGMLFVLTIITAIIAIFFVAFALPGTGTLYQLLCIFTMVVLSNLWMLANLLSGLRVYRSILLVFVIGYALTILFCWLLWGYGIAGLMLGFFIGQAILFFGLLAIITYNYFSLNTLAFDCFRPGRMYVTLIFSGLFFNLAIWADKYCFWYYKSTGYLVIGHLHASLIYDLPIYLAFFLIIPGFAVFLFRMETDFVACYQRYYDAIRDGGSLKKINTMHSLMVQAVQMGLLDIIKIQFLCTIIGFYFSARILAFFEFPTVQAHLLRVDILAIDFLVLFIGMLNVTFYLDKRKQAVCLCLLFFILNLLCTWLSLLFGLYYYGYGLLVAVLICNFVAFWVLDRDFYNLTYETFMLSYQQA